MKRMLVLAAFVAVFAGAGIAYAATSGGGLPGGEPAVWGGGHAAPIGDRDFSIVATPDGGEFIWGQYGLESPFLVGDVTCVKVSGNHAVIGGILRESSAYGGAYVGYPFIWFVIDNGKLAATAPDQVSPSYIVEKSDIANHWSGLTQAFPYVCPSFSAMGDDVTMADLTGGDIVVQHATQNSQQ
jgi:hypothetical protein